MNNIIKRKDKLQQLRPLTPILLHVGLGFLAFAFRPFMKVYVVACIIYFIYRFITKKNKEKEVLIACAYMAGGEVFFRMTKAMVFYETGKYAVILFLIFGMFYEGFKRKAYPYVFYILLLLPGLIGALDYFGTDLFLYRKTILFNLSGPISLCVAALFCYGRRLKMSTFLQILDTMLYPIIAMTVYLYLYTPENLMVTNTASNASLSGGYGANQVSTMLGLGVFILFTRLLIPYKNKLVQVVMMIFLIGMAHRALLTFSRGGVFVAILISLMFIVMLYFSSGLRMKAKLTYKILITFAVTIGIWLFALSQTGGLLGNRYGNEDALGREKEDIATGRGDLLSAEIDAFTDEPIFGIGIGATKIYHEEHMGVSLPTHNEVSRMLAEHGLFGILALLILIFAPLVARAQGLNNIYFYSFLAFWLLTVAHSSMRIAAPGFIYGLALLNLSYGKKKKNTLPRKSTLPAR
ncbi:O-antigen ligase family protein [Mesonia ostreae]|uniref:O-antigen ligase family protein n=1 Tax=Mesonia ostreae TaxID=861110 RepID=A0ABU2KLY2_9FLAO|nr:O-antigen ligase family protein [Mesonia ostreae]MDT0295726.1 O-antigen ligase family protein [Mesonia ostreae]